MVTNSDMIRVIVCNFLILLSNILNLTFGTISAGQMNVLEQQENKSTKYFVTHKKKFHQHFTYYKFLIFL